MWKTSRSSQQHRANSLLTVKRYSACGRGFGFLPFLHTSAKEKKFIKITDSLFLPGWAVIGCVMSWAHNPTPDLQKFRQAIWIHHIIFSVQQTELKTNPVSLMSKPTDSVARIALSPWIVSLWVRGMEVHAPLDKPHLDPMFFLSWQFAAFSLPTRPSGQLMGCWNMNYSFGFKVNQNMLLHRHMITHMITAW